MKLSTCCIILAGAAAAAGCDLPPSGESERQEAANQMAAERSRAGAEGKAEEGRLSIKAPGIDIAVAVPDAVRDRARANVESEFMPPGSRVRGVHIEGDGGNLAAARDSVEIRFTAQQAPADVVAWYRDAARRPKFTISGAERAEGEQILTGTTAEGAPLRVHIAAREAGTDGRLVLVDRD
ncbi:MAG TPA: hypothetical protein VF552_12680 [Allosphingosinicella sp.]|jgi:hypothetical protein